MLKFFPPTCFRIIGNLYNLQSSVPFFLLGEISKKKKLSFQFPKNVYFLQQTKNILQKFKIFVWTFLWNSGVMILIFYFYIRKKYITHHIIFLKIIPLLLVGKYNITSYFVIVMQNYVEKLDIIPSNVIFFWTFF